MTDSDLLELVGEVRKAAHGLSVHSHDHIAQGSTVRIDTAHPSARG